MITGQHPEIIISDAAPTKWQVFKHNLNPFASKERKRVYKWFAEIEKDRKDKRITESDMTELIESPMKKFIITKHLNLGQGYHCDPPIQIGKLFDESEKEEMQKEVDILNKHRESTWDYYYEINEIEE